MKKKNQEIKRFWDWIESEDRDGERILRLDGEIAEDSWWGDEITPGVFRAELNKGNGPVTIWINSYGGDVFAAAQIYNMIREYPGKVTVKIDGIAASAATVIAMAGDEVLMSPVSMMMIHNPWVWTAGDARELEKVIDQLNSVKESIIGAYEVKTGKSREEISRLMDEETWFDATWAIENKFADGITERRPIEQEPAQNKTAHKFGNRLAVAALFNKLREAPEHVVPGQQEPKDESRARVVDLQAELNKFKTTL